MGLDNRKEKMSDIQDIVIEAIQNIRKRKKDLKK